MSNTSKLSKNLGFFTGPLMIVLGLMSLYNKKGPEFLAYFIIMMGIIRLGLTIYVSFKSKES